MNNVDEENYLVGAIANKGMDKIENLSLEANQISRGHNRYQRGRNNANRGRRGNNITDNLLDVGPAKSAVT